MCYFGIGRTELKMTILTKNKYQELKKELKILKERRKELAQILAETKAHGDLSENSEYITAKEEASNLNLKINNIENVLREAELATKVSAHKVGIGSDVVLEYLPLNQSLTNKRIKVKLVGWGESSPDKGEISVNSPLGKALLGKVKNEKVWIKTPSGEKGYKIVSVK